MSGIKRLLPTPNRRKPGRPPGRKIHTPTDEMRRQVKQLISLGIPLEDVATFFDIGRVTLEKYYRREIDTGHIEANAAVAQSLFNQATGPLPSTAATIFWLKVRNRWKTAEDVAREESVEDLARAIRAQLEAASGG